LAHWVNASIGILVGMLVIFAGLADFFCLDHDQRREIAVPTTPRRFFGWARAFRVFGRGVELLIVLTGLVAGLMLQKLAPYQTTWPMIASPLDIPSRIQEIMVAIWNSLNPTIWTYFLLVVAGSGSILMLIIPSARPKSRSILSVFFSITMTVVCYSATVAIIFQPRWRYCLPAVMVFGVGLSTTLVPLCTLFGAESRRRLTIVTTVGVIIIAAIANGPPSLDRVYRSLDRTLGALTSDLVDTRCTHLSGNYWKVWIAVFHVNNYYYGSGRPERIWGITHRSAPTRDLWGHTPDRELRLAIPIDDQESLNYLNYYDFPRLHEVETHGTIRVLVPTEEVRD
jgi:hypothetical protein